MKQDTLEKIERIFEEDKKTLLNFYEPILQFYNELGNSYSKLFDEWFEQMMDRRENHISEILKELEKK